jgi:hypothetical protein
VCWVPGFEQFKVPTVFPSIPEGVGMTCREVSLEDLGSTYVELGRSLRDVLNWIEGLVP